MQGTTVFDVFEEFRFIAELLVAELMFLLPFSPMKKGFFKKLGILFVVYVYIAMFYFELVAEYDAFGRHVTVIGSWYILLTISTFVFCKALFEINTVDCLYIIISSFTSQHIVYVLIHEWTLSNMEHYFRDKIQMYIGMSVVACALIYWVIYMLFARRLNVCEGRLHENSFFMKSFYILALVIMNISTYSAQYLFRVGKEMRGFGVLWGLTTCVFILGIEYADFRSIIALRDQAMISRMLKDAARHYEMSKELIDLVNRNAHDMKHKLKALRKSSDEQRNDFIDSQMSNIENYQKLVFCDNEVLNTILAEKSLYCTSKSISFSCSVKQANLDFIEVTDLYALLGNAIDNAIESVSKFEDADKRVINLTVFTKSTFTFIQVENYSDETKHIKNYLPVTTKNGMGHGFGLKSIKYIAKKYGGNMYWTNTDGIFSLQVSFPIPVMPE